jgi:hypothetical protein
MENCHPRAPPKPIQIIQNPDEDEIVPLLSDMIAMGMTDEVKALSPRFKDLEIYLRERLVQEAAFSGPLQIFQCLLDQCNLEGVSFQRLRLLCAIESIRGENIEILQWLVPGFYTERKLYGEKLDFMHLGANAESTEVFEVWKTYLGTYKWGKLPMITEDRVLQRVKDPVKQERLASALSEQASLGHLTTYHLSRALKAVASTNCSVTIARVLLDSGAAVDFRSPNSRGTELMKTPLIAAAAKRTMEGAEMMKLLLLAGADPSASYQKKRDSEPITAGMEPGAKKISKWLGLTWDELVEWAAEQRSNNLQGEMVSRINS